MSVGVSVIIPVYNVSLYIERCARSLFEQSFQDAEFIFVDDATPDDSMEILERVIRCYPEIQTKIKILHNKQNKGLAATRFVGLAEACGLYVLHCDSDDWVEQDMLKQMYEEAIATNADMVCCEAVKENGGSNRSYYHYSYDEETIDNGLLSLNFTEIHVAVWNKLVKRDLYVRYDIYNYPGINMGEDSALTFRLRYYSRCTRIIHKPFYHYNRENQGSMVKDMSESSIMQKIELASYIEGFFRRKNELSRFRHVVNYYKFDSKQYYLRNQNDLKKWRTIYPESHEDIFRFKGLTFMGKIKWWMCAYLPIPDFIFRIMLKHN